MLRTFNVSDLLTAALRTVLLVAALSAPLAFIPVATGGQQVVIEAPGSQKVGAGFVLLMSLQRG